MKKLKSLLKQPLTWIFTKMKIILQSNGETITELIKEKPSKATFEPEGKKFNIQKEIIWNPKMIIEQNDCALFVLKRHFPGIYG